ncbi:MAG: glycosyltransferase family 2 protein [Coriobacteriia bacterium]
MATNLGAKAAIIIVNWNGWEDTIACLDSCAGLDYANREMLVIDNGSTNDSVARIRAAHPSVAVLETGANLGFAGGNNVGILTAIEHGASYIWLLNNDTTVEPRALSALVETIAANPDAGVAGSKITYFDRPDVLWYAGGEFTSAGPVRHRGLDEPDTGQYELLEETGFVTGCSLFTTAEIIDRLGLLAEEYFLYWEEADFDWRVHAAGYKLLYVPESVVRHKVARSLGESWGTAQTKYLVRNMLLFYRRNQPERVGAIYRKALRDGFGHLTHRRFGLAWATFAGVWLYSTGQFGPIAS